MVCLADVFFTGESGGDGEVNETMLERTRHTNSEDVEGNGCRPYIIAVEGAVGSGKSTLVNNLLEAFGEIGYTCVKTPEAAKVVLMKYAGNDEQEMSTFLSQIRKTEHYVFFQNEVLQKQIEYENYCRNADADIAIVDRTLYSWLYFFTKYCGVFSYHPIYLRSMELFNGAMNRKHMHDLVVMCDYRDVNWEEMSGRRIRHRAREDIELAERKIQHNFLMGLIKSSRFRHMLVSGNVFDRVTQIVTAVVSDLERRAKEGERSND